MKRKLYAMVFAIVPLFLLFLITPAFAEIPVPQEPSDSIYYFMLSETEGLSILEIWGNPDFNMLEELGYKIVTQNDIHNNGDLTPTESEAEADKNGDIDKGFCDAVYGYSSWINTRTSGSNKIIEAGSKTSRPILHPGSLWLCCTLKVITIPGSPQGISGTYGPYSTSGWYTSYTFTRSYPRDFTRTWIQKGWHHWGNPNDKRWSQAIRRY